MSKPGREGRGQSGQRAVCQAAHHTWGASAHACASRHTSTPCAAKAPPRSGPATKGACRGRPPMVPTAPSHHPSTSASWPSARSPSCAPAHRTAARIHANLSPTTRNWPFSVLGFWDKNTAMPYIAGILRPLPGSRHFKRKGGHFVSWR